MPLQTQKHPEYSGPALGPKMAAENKRNFSEEEVRRMRDAEVGIGIAVMEEFESNCGMNHIPGGAAGRAEQGRLAGWTELGQFETHVNNERSIQQCS